MTLWISRMRWRGGRNMKTCRPSLPRDYLEYVSRGGRDFGFTNLEFGGYFHLYPVDSIGADNDVMEVDAFAPGLIAFAGNGGGEFYAFDDGGVVYSVPLIGMSREDAIRVASSWSEFVLHITDC